MPQIRPTLSGVGQLITLQGDGAVIMVKGKRRVCVGVKGVAEEAAVMYVCFWAV